jgi:MOSC domain-containing protein YiiM
MISGKLLAIYIAPKTAANVFEVAEAVLKAGQGIVGDRYFSTFDSNRGSCLPDEQLTLIAMEDLITVKAVSGIDLLNGQHRRNLVTEGIDLTRLIGQLIDIGPTRIFVSGSCEPCDYLEQFTMKGLKSVLMGRGGLRGTIVRSGIIRKGEIIKSLGEK